MKKYSWKLVKEDDLWCLYAYEDDISEGGTAAYTIRELLDDLEIGIAGIDSEGDLLAQLNRIKDTCKEPEGIKEVEDYLERRIKNG